MPLSIYNAVELRADYFAAPYSSFRDFVAAYFQFAEFSGKSLHIKPRVQKRGESHIPAYPAETVKIRYSHLFIRLAKYPAPKPLSIFTTAMPGEQQLSMVKSGAMPLKLAPYPTLVGTAITGFEIRPLTTLASAPSIPAMTMITLASSRSSLLSKTLCSPATPTSYRVFPPFPINSNVAFASSATLISAVPPVTTKQMPFFITGGVFL